MQDALEVLPVWGHEKLVRFEVVAIRRFRSEPGCECNRDVTPG
jgi:hypothetical protein